MTRNFRAFLYGLGIAVIALFLTSRCAAAQALPPWAASSGPCGGFTDVDPAAPSCAAVEWVKNRGITLGCTTNAYCPTATVTREQLALMLYRASATPEVISIRDRTESENQAWQSNTNACGDLIPAKPYPRTAVVQAALSLRYSSGVPGTRWPVEWQIQYSLDASAGWHAANELAYADTAVDWFFTSNDSGSFVIPAGKEALVAVHLFYLGVPAWGRCNVTMTLHATDQVLRQGDRPVAVPSPRR